MVRLFIFSAAIALVLLILALISSLSAERARNMPRFAWILVILLIPIAGPIAWFLTGRPVSPAQHQARRPASPDDDPEFLRSMDSEQSRRDRELLAQWEREMGRSEEPHDERPTPRAAEPREEPRDEPRDEPREERKTWRADEPHDEQQDRP
ncbi:PLD nuclease N-terminal domain-containing protein [Actinoplanes derwentensis]|uniref:Phospholipase_D-nuclease N-terminal n=1 Tax=Actinoplanes derwentensis TaxID=113562 RepID=A0A1H2D487_9ACTN|nr:PLD nuclease N-terminal domain-containing protein [Actinoplanes derwentensis]SDT77379.1 Phospholipase_D-nuclease N-terminal [Actinoplanes derwentensis]